MTDIPHFLQKEKARDVRGMEPSDEGGTIDEKGGSNKYQAEQRGKKFPMGVAGDTEGKKELV